MNEKGILVKEIIDQDIKSSICEVILHDLSKWFGIPEANAEYIKGVKDKTFYAAECNGNYIGFISILEHNFYTSEIYLIGLLNKYRNKGVGTSLLKFAVSRLKKEKKVYLTVKTLADTHPSKEYRETREFYLAKEFLPLEIFPDLWGESNPCLLMVKKI